MDIDIFDRGSRDLDVGEIVYVVNPGDFFADGSEQACSHGHP